LNDGPLLEGLEDLTELFKGCDRLPACNLNRSYGKSNLGRHCARLIRIIVWKRKATSISRRTPSKQNFSSPTRGIRCDRGKEQSVIYDVEVGAKRNHDAAWFYPEPKPAANQINRHVAFWKGVRVEK
jgi:hypothetical protein